MYEMDKRQRITLRLSDEQFLFVKSQCQVLGITPSDYIRMLVNAVIYQNKKGNIKEVFGRENDKTISHD